MTIIKSLSIAAMGALALAFVLAYYFPDARDRILDDIFDRSWQQTREAGLLEPPSQPLICGTDFISFYAEGV